jgi:hypothetical protein
MFLTTWVVLLWVKGKAMEGDHPIPILAAPLGRAKFHSCPPASQPSFTVFLPPIFLVSSGLDCRNSRLFMVGIRYQKDSIAALREHSTRSVGLMFSARKRNDMTHNRIGRRWKPLHATALENQEFDNGFGKPASTNVLRVDLNHEWNIEDNGHE